MANMTVKVGDIVRYAGIEQRLMMCSADMFRLSHDGHMGFSSYRLRLVESTTLPELKVGDLVYVNNIPIEEKNQYVATWDMRSEETVNSSQPYTIDFIHNTKCYGQVFEINGRCFLPYHLTPTMDYDMI